MRRRSIELGISSAFLLLLISRSILLPAGVSQLAPILALMFVLAGLLPHLRTLRVPSTAAFLVLLAVTYSSSSAASGSFDNFLRATSIGVLWLVVFVVAYNLREPERKRLLVTIVIVAVIETGVAVGETLLALPELRNLITATQDGSYLVRPNTILGPWTNRAQGTTGYPIPFSHLLSLSAVITLFAPLGWNVPKRLAIASMLGVGILLSGTRSGVAAVVACTIVGIFMLFRAKYSGIGYVFLFLFVLAGFSAAVSISSQEGLSGDGSYTHRMGILGSVFELFKLPAERFLFGSGINSHESLFSLNYFQGDSTYAIDNSFVTLLIYTGLLGLASFVTLVVIGLRRGSVAEISVLVGYMVFSMSYDFVNWHLLAFIFFLFLGLAHRGDQDPVSPSWHKKSAQPQMKPGS